MGLAAGWYFPAICDRLLICVLSRLSMFLHLPLLSCAPLPTTNVKLLEYKLALPRLASVLRSLNTRLPSEQQKMVEIHKLFAPLSTLARGGYHKSLFRIDCSITSELFYDHPV